MIPWLFGVESLEELHLHKVQMAGIITLLVLQPGLLEGELGPGVSVGATDEFGYKAVENKYEIHDLHATMLHLLGIEHTESTFRFGGRDMRLTEVYGHLIKEIL